MHTAKALLAGQSGDVVSSCKQWSPHSAEYASVLKSKTNKQKMPM
jgi:hypothetical protein